MKKWVSRFKTPLLVAPLLMFLLSGAITEAQYYPSAASSYSQGFQNGYQASQSGYEMGEACAAASTRQASVPNNQPKRYQESDFQCASDYDCGYGNVCVKDQYKATGSCAKAVNEYGNPTLQPPNPASVQVGGEGDCSFDTDCPIGFKCFKGVGQLKGSCLK